MLPGRQGVTHLARDVVAVAIVIAVAYSSPRAETVAVRYRTGTTHGYLELRSKDGRLLASGEQIQDDRGDRVSKRLTFHFLDGSLDDESSVFSASGQLRLVTYRHVQTGPSFPHPIDVNIDAPSRHVTVRYQDGDRKWKTEDTTLDLPADLSNGLITNVLENVRPASLPLTVSYLAATPKPRIIKLQIHSAGRETFSTAGARQEATHYVIAIHVGGVEGFLGTIAGKLPDSHVWMSEGVPTFLRSETILYAGAPLWRIEPAPLTLQTQ